MYDTAEYAKTRLVNTLIRNSKGEIIYVTAIGNQGKHIVIEYYNTKTRNDERELMNKCNLKPLPLGYIQIKKECRFITRQPLRYDWRQGLRFQNITNDLYGLGELHQFARYLQDCVDDNYPTLTKALKKVGKNFKSVAVSRKFSLDNNHKVWYKRTIVGDIIQETGDIILLAKYKFLREQLDEVVT